MPRYKIVLEARGPLLLGESLPADNIRSSRSFVAGSVLRGTLAKAILTPLGLWRHNGRLPVEQGLPDPFRQVFLANPLAGFGFLYPIRANSPEASKRETFPLPLTARTCKAHKGFQDKGHGVFDRLMADLRHAAGNRDERAISTCLVKECGERLERLRGFGARETGPSPVNCEVKIAPRSFVRVGLNRRTETAEEGILYTLEALVPGPGQEPGQNQDAEEIEPPLSFVGYWTMTETQLAQLKELLDKHVPALDGGYALRLGSARMRGMGAVVLYLPTISEPEIDPSKRLDKFQPRDEQGQLLDEQHCYFGLTLRSPMLMYDALGRLATKAEAEILSAYITPPSGLEILPDASFVEQEMWSGWGATWGLPKPITPALAPGTVLSFRAPAQERAAVITFLRELEKTGLGERRAEGWGEVTPCDPFHVQFDQEAYHE